MKRLLITPLAVLLLLALVAVSCSGSPAPSSEPSEKPAPSAAPAEAEVIELSLHSHFPEVAGPAKAVSAWIDEIGTRTNGKVKITPYWNSAKCPMDQAFDSTVAGMVDICENDHSATPGRFSLWDFPYKVYADTGFPNLNKVYYQVRQQYPELDAQFAPAKVLLPFSWGTTSVMTTKKPIRTLDDFKGMKLVAIGEHVTTLSKELGFTGVSMGPGDWYSAMDKGVVDGAIVAPTAGRDHKLMPVLKYVTKVNLFGAFFELLMNQDSYDSLPPDVQAVFDEVSGEWARDYFNTVAYEDWVGALEAYPQNNVEVIDVAPEEIAKINDKLDGVYADWADSLESKGLPAQGVLDEFHRLIKDSAYQN